MAGPMVQRPYIENCSVCWRDIAIGENGPELLEGNDNWGKDTWQISDIKGKRYVLEELDVL